MDPAKLEAIRRYFPHGVFGRDREGYPVVIMRQGKMDAEAIRKVCSMDDMEFFWVQQNEYFVRPHGALWHPQAPAQFGE